MKALNAREKVLSFLVGGTVLLLVNVFVIQFLLDNYRKLQADYAAKTQSLRVMRELVANTGPWKEREEWLSAKQPLLQNPATAAVDLLREVKDIAQQQGVAIEQQALGEPQTEAQYTAVNVTLETKSTWEAMVRFMHALQNPGQFLVVDNANLRIDTQDQTKMRGQWRVSKWYTPQ